MSNKPYIPEITIRKRKIDNWYGIECPDCGASVLDKTVNKVKKHTKRHGKDHNWTGIKFIEQ